ncbi:MAG: 16S rRNA (cytosine(1402)-N(4))-methyltransferase RsmH [Hydrogenibacillus sp.]|nr:16S rRNA (cytosine(1402)-N(4))-methyltransferase RsmH [Hydrogenibacillus sp.]
MGEYAAHIPVLRDEAIEMLRIRPDGTYVDCTFGRGGHSVEIFKRLRDGRLIAVDRDEEAIRAGETVLRSIPSRGTFALVHANFAEIDRILSDLGIRAVDGVLYDLGVSSPQLDVAERGFSYQHDAPLDMRMDRSQRTTAYELVNTADEAALAEIIRIYGEERFARAIARAIVRARSRRPIRSTVELAELVKAAIPAPARRSGPHPAKRTFQALRIAVNDELQSLRISLKAAVQRLAPGGRVAVISFHSLEDRIVKETFRSAADPCADLDLPPHLPCDRTPILKLITRRPISPSAEEIAENPRARSAKLRVAERLP